MTALNLINTQLNAEQLSQLLAVLQSNRVLTELNLAANELPWELAQHFDALVEYISLLGKLIYSTPSKWEIRSGCHGSN